MKKKILTLVLLAFLSINSRAQIAFENGYFINEANQKINCLIKNNDWKNNPTEFEYKLPNEELIQKGGIKTIREFGIDSEAKYIRTKVNIDRSTDDINKMTMDRNPVFNQEQLFLKVIIEGNACLFSYDDINISRYFYKFNDSEISQLVYKRFLNNLKEIEQNNLFKQQLFNDLKCNNIAPKKIENIRYDQRDLEKIFLNYNTCTNSSSTTYESKQKKDLFNLTVRPGLNLSSVSIGNSSSKIDNIDFENKANLRFGIEAEFILPYYKNKWAVIVEPTFRNYRSEVSQPSITTSGGIINAKINYQSIELPIGVLHYIFLNEKSKLFLNVAFILDFSSNSKIELTRKDGSELYKLDINTRNNFGLGIGYKYGKRFSFELRNATSRKVLGSYLFWNSEYKSFAAIIGYSIF